MHNFKYTYHLQFGHFPVQPETRDKYQKLKKLYLTTDPGETEGRFLLLLNLPNLGEK